MKQEAGEKRKVKPNIIKYRRNSTLRNSTRSVITLWQISIKLIATCEHSRCLSMINCTQNQIGGKHLKGKLHMRLQWFSCIYSCKFPAGFLLVYSTLFDVFLSELVSASKVHGRTAGIVISQQVKQWMDFVCIRYFVWSLCTINRNKLRQILRGHALKGQYRRHDQQGMESEC